MNAAKLELAALVVLGALAVAGFLKLKQAGAAGLAAGVANAVGDAATGTVLGVGDVLGVPRTEASKGEAEWQAGNYWQASFDLPAGAFLGHVWDGVKNAVTPATTATPPINPDAGTMGDPAIWY